MLLLHPSSTCDHCREPFVLNSQDDEQDVSERKPCSLPCGHVFCEQCLHSEEIEQACPGCSTPFDIEHDVRPLAGVSIYQDEEGSTKKGVDARLRSRLLSLVEDTKREIEELLPAEHRPEQGADRDRDMPRSVPTRSRSPRERYDRKPYRSSRKRGYSPRRHENDYYRSKSYRQPRRDPTPPYRPTEKLPARSPAPLRRTYSPEPSGRRKRSSSRPYRSRSRSPRRQRSRDRAPDLSRGINDDYHRDRTMTMQTSSTMPAVTILPLGPGRLHTIPVIPPSEAEEEE